MDPRHHERVGEHFHYALGLDASERPAYLAALREDDPRLADDVASLLSAHEDDGMLPDSGPEEDPRRIGAYRLIRPLGEGGMGVVYLAERQGEGFTQTVAVKLLRGGFVDPALEARFRAERAILARLEHPGIARLIDGGVTSEGQPYYAMERVEGVGLLEYCDRQRLPVRERLELFLAICAPVRHAHQQLVIHRDLKPANIMVTNEGQVKLLDFGVAKLLDPDPADEQRTRTAAWVTPSYAAPEQIRGDPASTLSDVYALGVILYEMLTGHRPYALSSRSPAEVERILFGTDPARPSTVLVTGPTGARDPTTTGPTLEDASAARSTTPERLQKTLRGDLDTVVLKALEREPARRYGSVVELADDVRRYLDGRPVAARPASLGYRMQRFVARNRAAVLAGVLLGGSLLAGAFGTTWQASRARAERDRARLEADKAERVAGLMMDIFRLSDPGETLGDTITAREILDRGAARVEAEFSAQPRVQADLLLEIARVYANLGMLETSESLARQTLAIREREFGSNSLEASASLAFLGGVVAESGRGTEAEPILREAARARESRLSEPDTLLATTWFALGALVRSAGDHEEARTLMRRALETRRALLPDDDPLVAEAVFGLASAFHDGGLLTDAEEMFVRILEDHPIRGRAHPLAARAAQYVGQLRFLRGDLRAADSLFAAAHRMNTALYPGDHPSAIASAQDYAAVLVRLGRFEEADRLVSDGLESAVRLYGERHPEATSLRVVRSQILEARGEWERAAAVHDTVIAHKRLRYGGDHADLMYSYLRAGEAGIGAGDAGAARALFVEADRMRLRMNPASDDGPGVARLLSISGWARIAELEEEWSDATRLHDQAVDMAAAVLRPGHRYAVRMRLDRAAFLLRRGRPEAALPELQRGLQDQLAMLLEPHGSVAATLADLAETERALGHSGWRSTLERAESNLDGLPDSHALRARIRDLAGGVGSDPAR